MFGHFGECWGPGQAKGSIAHGAVGSEAGQSSRLLFCVHLSSGGSCPCLESCRLQRADRCGECWRCPREPFMECPPPPKCCPGGLQAVQAGWRQVCHGAAVERDEDLSFCSSCSPTCAPTPWHCPDSCSVWSPALIPWSQNQCRAVLTRPVWWWWQ